VQIENVPAVVRAANRWAAAQGLPAAIPTFEQADHGNGVVYGIWTLKPSAVTWRDVPLATIGAAGLDDVGAMMRGASDYAANNGFAGGYPTFEEANYGNGVVVGINLLRPGAAIWRDVFADILTFQSTFTFSADFTEPERQAVMERWAFAYERLLVCGSLSASDITKVKNAFGKKINHTLAAAATANASAPINGSTVNINRTNFFGLIPREQAQTLLHELCHSAGFNHPDRRDCPPLVAPNCDNPFDNGPYYGTVPLQAELCIAGVQSDTVCVPGPDGQACGTVSATRIIAVEYNPPGSDVEREYVNIVNTGGPQQMQGWTLRDAAGHTFVFPAFLLPGGDRVKVWTGAGRADAQNLYWGRKQAVWNNTGDTATLSDAAGTAVNSFSYTV
jgi:hypothetical protein